MKSLPNLVMCLCLLGATVGVRASEFLPAVPMPSAALDADTTVTRIALGSCFSPYESDSIFAEIAQQRPDVFLFMGDNVYARDESEDPQLNSLREAYAALAQAKSFAALRQRTPLLAAWDDHDYGQNDVGSGFYAREYSEQLFEHVWSVPSSDPRRQHPGTYFSTMVGPVGQRVQFIVLDTRFFSSPYTLNPDQKIGRYTASTDPKQNMLGEAQWRWLSQELAKPADLRILLSSIQVVAAGHFWESWAMMPQEQQRLYELLAGTDNLLIVSGDRHSGAIYERTDVAPYPLYELTSSSLNIPLTSFVDDPQDEPGPYRLTNPYYEANYGLIEIDWQAGQLQLQLRDINSEIVAQQSISLSALQHQPQ